MRSQHYRGLFPKERQVLFVYRGYVHKWLKTLENDIMHFGDIDLAGIEIYLNEIVPCIKHDRHTFFIPNNVNELLKKGDKKLYEKQIKLSRYQNLSTQDNKLLSLIESIYHYKSGLEQQGL